MKNSIYTVYITGTSGNSIAMLIFLNGTISGADIGGGIYDGTYNEIDGGQFIEGRILFTLPINVSSVVGIPPQSEPTSFEVPIRLPSNLDHDQIYRIETPAGPINTRFIKTRDL